MKPVKTLILICGGLMATAFLMGTIDFAKANKNGELKNLYKDGLEPLAAIPLLNNEQLRLTPPPPPPPPFFSRAPIGQRSYTQSEYLANLTSLNSNSLAGRLVKARASGRTLNKEKLKAPPILKFSSFSRGDLRTRISIKSKEEEVPNDK